MGNEERIENLEREVKTLKNIIYSTIVQRPTEKQMQVIDYIESNLGIKFMGGTKQDARDFISKNIKLSKESHKVTI